jgi:cytochrome c oxidase subunit I+III
VLAAVGTGFLSFGLWVHHMFTTGLPGISLVILRRLEAVGSRRRRSSASWPRSWRRDQLGPSLVFGGLTTFVLGGLTGVMVALVPFDLQAHDTFFVVGHLHYVLIGGALFPVVAGFYYFFPLVNGKQLSERLGRIAFWLMCIGFHVTFLPMHLTGLRGMPRRVFTYPADLGFDALNLTSSLGAFILAAGLAVFVWDVFCPKGKQPLSARNPWDAGTLEWLADMPGKPWGVRSIPEIDSRYPLWDQPHFMRDVDQGRFYLPDAEEEKRETLVTSTIDAQPLQCLRVPGPTFVTFFAAMFTGGIFIFSTFHWWWLAAISSVQPSAPLSSGCGQGRPSSRKEARMSVSVSGAVVCLRPGLGRLVGDVHHHAWRHNRVRRPVFGYFFYWTIHADFPPDPPMAGRLLAYG